MEEQKIKISIIDFLPKIKKIEVGKYKDGTTAYLGDVVSYQKEDNWFIVYRYGKIMIKQVGMIAMIAGDDFQNGDFSKVEKTNVIGAGNDWLIIGYAHESIFKKIEDLV